MRGEGKRGARWGEERRGEEGWQWIHERSEEGPESRQLAEEAKEAMLFKHVGRREEAGGQCQEEQEDAGEKEDTGEKADAGNEAVPRRDSTKGVRGKLKSVGVGAKQVGVAEDERSHGRRKAVEQEAVER